MLYISLKMYFTDFLHIFYCIKSQAEISEKSAAKKKLQVFLNFITEKQTVNVNQQVSKGCIKYRCIIYLTSSSELYLL